MKYGKYHCYSSYCFVYKMIIVTKVQLLSGRKLAKGARRQIVCHLIYYESENNLARRQFMLVLQRKILISRQPSPFYYKPSITAFLLEWKFCTCNKHMAHPPKVFTTQPLSGKKNSWPLYKLFWPIVVCEQRIAAWVILMKTSLAAVLVVNWREGRVSQETTEVYSQCGSQCRINWGCVNY